MATSLYSTNYNYPYSSINFVKEGKICLLIVCGYANEIFHSTDSDRWKQTSY